MFMKKSLSAYKILIWSSVAAIILITLIFLVLVPGRGSSNKSSVISSETALAIPTDASAFFLFKDIETVSNSINSVNDLFGRIIFGNSPLNQLIDKLYSISGAETLKDVRDYGCALSYHYSSKDEVSPLFVLKLKDGELTYILGSLKDGNSRTRQYNGISVYKWNNVEYASSGGFLLASPSPLILESSLRQILSGSSILDNTDLADLLVKTELRETMLFINHAQCGKLFSAYSNRRYLKYSDFISRVTSWSALEIYSQGNKIILRGGVFNSKGPANYSEVFRGSRGGKSDIASVIPHNSYSLLTLSIEDIPSYLKKFNEFGGFYKRTDPEIALKAAKWFASLDAKEVGAALIPYGSVFRNTIIIRTGKPFFGFVKRWLSQDKEMLSLPFNESGYMKLLFGEMFQEEENSYILRKGEYIIIGQEEVLTEVFAKKGEKFSFDEYISQTKAYNLLDRSSGAMTLIVNGSEQPDSLVRFFKKDVNLKGITKSLNLMVGAIQLKPDKQGNPAYEIFFYGDSLKELPQPGKTTMESPAGWERDTIVKIPAGPFEVINFSTGEKEFLEQLPNFWLRLSDKEMRGIWAVPFQVPLRGYVQQVDYYRNGKLQMLFAGGNRVFMLDRGGRFVSPYPISTDSLILLGPKVYNIKKDGDFAIMLLHTDNTLRLYDKNCKPYPTWSDINLPETIREFPELKDFGGNRYWILRTSLRTMIYSVNGIPVTDIKEKNRIKPDSPVIPLTGSDVLVQTLQGKNISINLETGDIKRYKQ